MKELTKSQKLQKYIQMASSKNVDDVNLCGVLIGEDPDFSYQEILEVMWNMSDPVYPGIALKDFSAQTRLYVYKRFTEGTMP